LWTITKRLFQPRRGQTNLPQVATETRPEALFEETLV
jgi:hypothetical protein